MHKVGIIGHKFEDLPINQATNELIKTIDLLTFQYNNNIIFNLGGERGVELVAGEYCLKNNIKYHLFLPQKPSIYADDTWYDYQKQNLEEQFSNAFSVTIYSSLPTLNLSAQKERDEILVKESNFIVAFWTGKKIGRTYNIIKYALENNKITLSGLNELKLITNKEL